MPGYERVRRLMGKAFLCANAQRMRTMRKWQRDPAPFQERLLLKHVHGAARTTFGREHDFKSIRSVEDYQKRVPLRSYLDFKPYWDRQLDGEADVTWPGQVRYFTSSGGTTGSAKWIPATRDAIRCHVRVGGDIRNLYFNQTRDLDIFCGQSLSLAGTVRVAARPHKVLMGNISAVTLQCTPKCLQRLRLPSVSVSAIDDWDARLDAIAEEVAHADIRVVSGLPVRLLQLLERLRRNQRREGHEISTLADVWPNLSLLVHGGANFDPYRSVFQRLFGKTVETMEVYAATEGYLAIQDRLDSSDLLLMMNTGIFYEFVPVSEIHASQPCRFTVADVEEGVDYAIVLSTQCGLWGYRLGDTVRFTSLRPHRLRVTGRTEQFVSVFGEHVFAGEVEAAIAHACSVTGAEVRDFHVAPVYPTIQQPSACHQWLIEFIAEPQDINAFSRLLDERLQRENKNYERFRRGNAAFRPLEPVVLPTGFFERVMRECGRSGAQAKTPRLCNNREFASLLLSAYGNDKP